MSRILAGLYEPTSGSVRWDGVDVRAYDAASLMGRVALVLQEPGHWPMTRTAHRRLKVRRARLDRGRPTAGWSPGTAEDGRHPAVRRDRVGTSRFRRQSVPRAPHPPTRQPPVTSAYYATPRSNDVR